MKPPVKIEDLMEMWIKDSAIDETEPGKETSRIPTLHAKYLRILTHHKMIALKHQSDYNTLKNIKFQYFSGDLNNPEDLEKYGYDPWSKRVLRQDIPMYLDSDKELNNLLLKKVMHQEIVDFCTTVLKEINNRTFQLGNLIKWEQFVGGR